LVVLVGWVFFRIEDFNQATFYIKQMFLFRFEHSLERFDTEFIFTMAIGFLFAFIRLSKAGKWLEKKAFFSALTLRGHILYLLLSIIFLLICTGYITASGFNPFIYFRF